MASFGLTQPLKKQPQEQDVQAPSPPGDSIASLALNGSAQVASTALLAASWDSTVSCYALQQQQQSGFGMAPAGGGMALAPAGSIRHEAPALCCDFASDNLTALSGGCDGQLKQWNIQQGPQSLTTVGRHDQPIRCLKWMTSHNVAVTGGWDKQIKVWDMRSPQPAFSLPVSERVYAMDAKNDAVVVGTADKNISVFDFRAQQKLAEYKSPLNYQTRCISIFEDVQGFAVGCIEGRVAIEYFSEMQHKNKVGAAKMPQSLNFVFKCHRDKQDIYAVNAIHFHQYNTFVTAGSDGVLSTWDKDNRSRLALFDMYFKRVPVTDAKFSPNGMLLAYSLSYDWSKGAGHAAEYQGKNAIMIHPMQPGECQQKKK
jgi:mRNA export factor